MPPKNNIQRRSWASSDTRDSECEKRREDLRASALAYAKRGIAVIPLHTPTGLKQMPCSCNRVDCGSVGKHPRTFNGLKDATTDPEIVSGWWSTWADANIGVVTGKNAGVVVLDIDGYEGHHVLEVNGYELPETLVARTGREQGVHLYLLMPDSELKSRNHLLPKIDIKADGGYVVAPPSKHQSGLYYEFIDSEAELAPIPDWLGKLLKRSEPNTKSATCQDDYAFFGKGERNDKLFRVGASMRRQGCSQEVIENALLSTNAAQCDPPLTELEVAKIAQSACRYEPGDLKTNTDTDGHSVSVSDERDVVHEAFKQAQESLDRGDVPECANRYSNGSKRLLVCLCFHLERICGSLNLLPWFLPCRRAGKLLGQPTHVEAASWLRELVSDGVLEVVQKGGPHNNRATRYRFIGSL